MIAILAVMLCMLATTCSADTSMNLQDSYLMAVTALLGNHSSAAADQRYALKSPSETIIELAEIHHYGPAQFMLGVLYNTGLGDFQVDQGLALTLYSSAAIAGYLPAQLAVAHHHNTGIGFKKSCQAALPFYMEAAKQWEDSYVVSKQPGFELAYLPADRSQKRMQHQLGEVQTLAASGNARALHTLGEFFYKGSHGLSQDFKEAFRYFKKSEGVTKSLLRLGMMNLLHLGVSGDYNTAMSYLKKASGKKSRRVLF